MKGKKLVVGAALLAVVPFGWAGSATAAQPGPVTASAADWTPKIATSGTDGSIEQIRQLVQCGSTMYAVGTFSSIRQGANTYARSNAFSFSATNGTVTGWNPGVNGTVNSVALSPDCSTAYLGGAFSTVGGVAAKNIVSVSTSTGAVNAGFKHTAGGQVSAMLYAKGHVLAGGYFPSINGSTRKYMASLNPTTGSDDGYVNLNISGNYVYTDDGGHASKGNSTRVYNYNLSPDGNRLLVMGVFTSVGGQGRRQIFMLDLGASSATVNPWYSTEFDMNCATVEPFWLQDAAWSPDGGKVYIATTGYKPANGPAYNTSAPRQGLCDVAASFPSTPGLVSSQWINHTGCDSLYSVAADTNTVYIGGHERWASNGLACDGKGPGAVDAPGMAGLSPTNGSVVFNPTRGRGLGADDMLVTDAGLWIASDNQANTDSCAGEHGHSGICFLPY